MIVSSCAGASGAALAASCRSCQLRVGHEGNQRHNSEDISGSKLVRVSLGKESGPFPGTSLDAQESV